MIRDDGEDGRSLHHHHHHLENEALHTPERRRSENYSRSRFLPAAAAAAASSYLDESESSLFPVSSFLSNELRELSLSPSSTLESPVDDPLDQFNRSLFSVVEKPPTTTTTAMSLSYNDDNSSVATLAANLTALAKLNEMTTVSEYLPPSISTFMDPFYGHCVPPNLIQRRRRPIDDWNLRRNLSNMSVMTLRNKFGLLGAATGMFNSPHGFCLGPHGDIVVADTNNHRIQVFDKDGSHRYFFGTPGKEDGCLWYPRKVAVLKNCNNFVICDRGGERSRMQIFTSYGTFLQRVQIRYIDIVAGLAISREGHILAVDSVTPTVFIISEQGVFLRHIECSEFMLEPSDIGVFGEEYYICDFKGHSVVVIHEKGYFVRRFGHEEVTRFPNGIDISDEGDVVVGDSHGNQFHVAIYSNSGQLLTQYICPHVKVSRCCGLKITSEGYIVTLAKNNHHVLVLNTLYVP